MSENELTQDEIDVKVRALTATVRRMPARSKRWEMPDQYQGASNGTDGE